MGTSPKKPPGKARIEITSLRKLKLGGDTRGQEIKKEMEMAQLRTTITETDVLIVGWRTSRAHYPFSFQSLEAINLLYFVS
jgi:hypothetical protein